MLPEENKRIYAFDNLKFILIVLVVFGHLLEIATGWDNKELKKEIYSLIYAFHMPVFMFLTGWFSKFKRRKIVYHLLYMYVFFQVIYQIFNHCFVKELPISEIKYQFTTPYWILWYLLATICYYLLIPLFNVDKTWKQCVVLAVCFAISLWWGNDKTVGYYLSVGRICTFLPYFFMGYYAKRQKSKIFGNKNWISIAGLCIMAVGVSFYVMKRFEVPYKAFYGAQAFEKLKITFADKCTIQLLGVFGIIFFIFALAPMLNFKIPGISAIGRNTLPIFLLHGFIIKWIKKKEMGEFLTPAYTIVIAIFIVMLLGNIVVAKGFKYLCTGWWLEWLHKKMDTIGGLKDEQS